MLNRGILGQGLNRGVLAVAILFLGSSFGLSSCGNSSSLNLATKNDATRPVEFTVLLQSPIGDGRDKLVQNRATFLKPDGTSAPSKFVDFGTDLRACAYRQRVGRKTYLDNTNGAFLGGTSEPTNNDSCAKLGCYFRQCVIPGNLPAGSDYVSGTIDVDSTKAGYLYGLYFYGVTAGSGTSACFQMYAAQISDGKLMKSDDPSATAPSITSTTADTVDLGAGFAGTNGLTCFPLVSTSTGVCASITCPTTSN